MTGLKPEEISALQAYTIVATRKPIGLYYFQEGNSWTAIDNTTGDAWTETFDTKEDCLAWLTGEGEPGVAGDMVEPVPGAVLANRSAADRNKTDFYETPEDVTTALLDFMESRRHLFPGVRVWDPACGRGAILEVLHGRGYEIIGSDLYPQMEGLVPMDFLKSTRPHMTKMLITNPPFSQAEEFIRHALELEIDCAFLLKSQFWHAKRRLQLLRDCPPSYILPLTWRPDFLFGAKSGSPTMDCLWTVWVNPKVRWRHPYYIPLERPGDGNG